MSINHEILNTILMYTYSASHVVILLAKKYPQCKIVNFDRLDCKYVEQTQMHFLFVTQIAHASKILIV